MAAVAQLVEPWIVIPVVVGSSPISRPILFFLIFIPYLNQTAISSFLFRITPILCLIACKAEALPTTHLAEPVGWALAQSRALQGRSHTDNKPTLNLWVGL